MTDSRPLPHPTAMTERFWKALSLGRLELLQCASCEHYIHPPRHYCDSCHGKDMRWTVAKNRGTVYTYSVIHRAPSPAFADKVPYAVGVVQIDDTDTRLLSNIDAPLGELAVGMPVEVVFEPVRDDFALFRFRALASEGDDT